MHSTALIAAALIPLGLAAPINSRQLPGEAAFASLGNGILSETGLSTVTNAAKGSLGVVEGGLLGTLKARNDGNQKRNEDELLKRQTDLVTGLLGGATKNVWPGIDKATGQDTPLANLVGVLKNRQEASAGDIVTGLLGGATQDFWPGVDKATGQDTPLANWVGILKNRQEVSTNGGTSAGDAITGLLGGATAKIWPGIDKGVGQDTPLANLVGAL